MVVDFSSNSAGFHVAHGSTYAYELVVVAVELRVMLLDDVLDVDLVLVEDTIELLDDDVLV